MLRLFLVATTLAAAPLGAATLTVTTMFDVVDDDGECSLREAIIATNDNLPSGASPGECLAGDQHELDTIQLGAGTFALTIEGSDENSGLTGDLDILMNRQGPDLVLRGQGAMETRIDATNISDRVFQIHPQSEVRLEALEVRGGRDLAADAQGGGGISVLAGALGLVRVRISGCSAFSGAALANLGGQVLIADSALVDNRAIDGGGGFVNAFTSQMTVSRSTISGNQANAIGGAGGQNSGDLVVENTTISGNTTEGNGGGLRSTGTLRLTSVTIAGNRAANGGGVELRSGELEAMNSIIASNDADASPDFLLHRGSVISSGFNLIGDGSDWIAATGDLLGGPGDRLDPLLGPLGDNGGPTLTHELLAGSPARDAGTDIAVSPHTVPKIDQRGEERPRDGDGDGQAAVDIGAFEAERASCVAGDTTLCIDNEQGDGRFRVTLHFETELGGGSEGEAQVIPLAPLGITQGGILSFFDPSNPELLVKVLDGCDFNDHYWVFFAATTNVGFELRVEDVVAQATRSYRNEDMATANAVSDTAAFATCDQAASTSVLSRPDSLVRHAIIESPGLVSTPGGGGCVQGDTTLCIDDEPEDGRFQVTLDFETVLGGGRSGNARSTPLAPLGVTRGGILSFFDQSNPEVLVKVLDGCGVNGRYWVFFAATTTVGYELRVEDKESGLVKTYSNPDLEPATTVTDTEAFASCS